jgi:hypothetical protein
METKINGGPQTEAGKEVSKMNALKHGLLSKAVLFHGENEEELLALNEQIKLELKPETKMERLLVDRVVSNTWRLNRALEMEEGEVIVSGGGMLGGGLMSDCDKFFRYETMLEKSIYKALHELERLQAKRNGQDVPLPVMVEVSMDSSFGKNAK